MVIPSGAGVAGASRGTAGGGGGGGGGGGTATLGLPAAGAGRLKTLRSSSFKERNAERDVEAGSEDDGKCGTGSGVALDGGNGRSKPAGTGVRVKAARRGSS